MNTVLTISTDDLVAGMQIVKYRGVMNTVLTISTNDLVAGMQIVKYTDDNKLKLDVKLDQLIPGTKGCRGLHFLTTQKNSVCYLPGGRVFILLEIERYLGGALDSKGWSALIDAVSPYPKEFTYV